MTDQETHSLNPILQWIDETFDVVVYPSGFENCIVGIAEKYDGPPVAVLDIEKMLATLEEQGMNHDEALEYFEFNILGAYVGEATPVYMHVPNFNTKEAKGKTKV